MTTRAAPHRRRKGAGYLLRRILHLLARPVRAARGQGTVAINCYRGYGSERELFLIGRVFRQPGYHRTRRRGTLYRDLRAILWRLFRYGMRDAVLTVRFAGREQEVTTDRDGYFRVHMQLDGRPGQGLWHPMEIELRRPDEPDAMAQGEIFIPPPTARTLVISDIDDTVVHTGVANKLMMMWRLFFVGAYSRVAFPGVAAFYRALHDGPGDANGAPAPSQVNPMLYVSRGPWSIYEVMTDFFRRHRIPIGPVLFLREWGFTLQRPLPPPARDHKVALIRHMMDIYDEMPVVLIGDSGQHDAELYASVVQEFPGRVRAVYIRNVSRGDRRSTAIGELARTIEAGGSTLVLAADSGVMARHAAGIGLIREDALPGILKAVEREQADEAPGEAAVEGRGAK